MVMTGTEIGYVAAVLAAGGYALVRTLRFLSASRRARLRGVEQRRRFEAVRTETPLDDPKQVAVERGIQSIETQFSVLRRLLVPSIVVATVALALLPVLAGGSASNASVIGAALAVVLGLALRPYLENAVAGLVISSSRLMRIGDTVRVDDWYGTVEDITPTHTTVKTWDWRRYLVPNSRMLQCAFFNYSLFDTYQWAKIEFWVAPDTDLDRVGDLAVAAARRSPHFSGSEEPRFWVMGMEKDAVRCWVAAWADTPSDAWLLGNDTRTGLLRELRREGIPLSLQRHRLAPEPDA